MRLACKLLLGLTLLQGVAYAADEPKIDVVDGKISISAQAVPLGRFLKLFDRAMGLNSEVKAGLENQNISVQFTDLTFNDAIRKIFQGQPLNYVVIDGKGIKVTDRAQSGASAGVSDSQPVSNSFQPVNSPFQPLPLNPQVNPIQPAVPGIFGTPPSAAANPPANPTAPLTGPGVMPPAIGASNPLVYPIGGPNAGGNVMPGAGGPVPSQPAAPGALPGAAPGTVK